MISESNEGNLENDSESPESQEILWNKDRARLTAVCLYSLLFFFIIVVDDIIIDIVILPLALSLLF